MTSTSAGSNPADATRRQRLPRPDAFTLDFATLPGAATAREMTVYREADRAAACRIEERVALPADGRVTKELPSGGGLLVHLNHSLPPPPLKM